MGVFEKLKQSLKKTREVFTKKLDDNLKKEEKITNEFYEELEEILIAADVGPVCSFDLVFELKKVVKEKKLKFKTQAKEELISILLNILKNEEEENLQEKQTIILVLGVNGVGKTTTIAKLCEFYRAQNKSVLIGAADTFRAAAIEQLDVWANRLNVALVKQKQGADPAAVVFDTIASAKKRKIDVSICDTAGRLHTKKNLMNELQKMVRILEKEGENLNKEILLTIDATTGQNGLTQAKQFKEFAKITGVVLTKLDGTAKGGIVIPIKKQLKLPIKFIGTGETLKDLQKFDAELFLNALFKQKEQEGKVLV